MMPSVGSTTVVYLPENCCKNGCNWGDLPKELPPYSTVYWYYKQWRDAGVIEKLMDALHPRVRQQVKKKALRDNLDHH